MRHKLPKPGDVMQVVVRNESIVYGYYVKAWERRGALVQFYECPSSWNTQDGFANSKKLFGPNWVGVNPPVREGRWTIIGCIPIADYKPPSFLMKGPPL